MRDNKTKEKTLFVKGAAEKIMRNSSHFLDSQGKRQEFTEDLKEKTSKEITRLAREGFRILAMSYKTQD